MSYSKKRNITNFALVACFLAALTPSKASELKEQDVQIEGGYSIRPMKTSDCKTAFDFIGKQRDFQFSLSDRGMYGSCCIEESFKDFKEDVEIDLIVLASLNAIHKSVDPEQEQYLVFKENQCVGLVKLSCATEEDSSDEGSDEGESLFIQLRDTIELNDNVVGKKEILLIEPFFMLEGFDHRQQAQYLLGNFINAYIKPKLGVSVVSLAWQNVAGLEEKIEKDIQSQQINNLREMLSQIPTELSVYAGACIETYKGALLTPILSNMCFKQFNPTDQKQIFFIDTAYDNRHLLHIPPSIVMAKHQAKVGAPFMNSGIMSAPILNLSNSVVINTGELSGSQNVALTASILLDNSFGKIKAPLVEIISPLFYPGEVYANEFYVNGKKTNPTGPYQTK